MAPDRQRDIRMTEPDFKTLRREFPVLARKTYLNSGSYCALANDVKAAFDRGELNRDFIAVLKRHSPLQRV